MDELREQATQDPETDSPEGELPEYMLRMIQQFEDNKIVVVEEDEVITYVLTMYIEITAYVNAAY